MIVKNVEIRYDADLGVSPPQKKERYIMRYNIRRWRETLEGGQNAFLENCERLEVVKQVIEVIDNAENFEAIVGEPEEG